MAKKGYSSFSAPIGAGLVIISSFFYASYGIWTTLMGDFFDGYTASALRSFLVVVFLLILTSFSKEFEKIELSKNWKPLLGMFASAMFTWGPLYYAILEAGVALSLSVAYASIVLGMFFFGWLFAREKITIDGIASAILGIIGLLVIFSPNLELNSLMPLLAAVISGLSAAAAMVLTKKVTYSSTQSTLALWVTSLLANALMVLVLHKPVPQFLWQTEWLYLVFFAISSIAASWCLVKGLKFIDSGKAGVLGLLEIVFSVGIGMILFNERPSFVALVGVMIVILAAAVPYFQIRGSKAEY